jgi:hypothetical protein
MFRSFSLSLTSVILSVVTVTPITASQQAVIDMFLEPAAGWGSVPSGDIFSAQTYNVGITGDLVAAEMYLRNDGGLANLTMRLTNLQNNRPSTDPADVMAIAMAKLPPRPDPPYQSLFNWVRFDFQPTRIVKGERLAFVFGSDQNHPRLGMGSKLRTLGSPNG